MMKRFLGKENRGITLVELLVTVALLTIVGGAITAFLSFTQRSYAKGVTKTGLQSESQLVADQIQKLLVDAVDVTKEADAEKYEVIYEGKDSIFLIYDAENQKIQYQEGSELADLATEVEGFSLDLTRIDVDRTVIVYLRLTKGDGTSYAASHKVYLRNAVPQEEATIDWMDGVTLNTDHVKVEVGPADLYVWPGSSYALSALVTVTKDDGSSIQPLSYQQVDWEVSGTFDDDATKTNVNDNTNVLEVDLEEIRDTDGQFTISARKLVGENWKAAEQTLTAKIRRIDRISFSDNLGNSGNSSVDEGVYSGESFFVTPGSDLSITPVIEGQNIDGLSLTDLGGLDLVIDDNNKGYVSNYTYNRNTGKITIYTNASATVPEDGGSFTVTLTCRQYGFTSKKLVLTYALRSRVAIDLVANNTGITSGELVMQRNGDAYFKFSDASVTAINELKSAANDTTTGYIKVKTTYLLNGVETDALKSATETYVNNLSGAKQLSGNKYIRYESKTPMVFGFDKTSTKYDFYLKLREDTVAYGENVKDVDGRFRFDQVRLDVEYYTNKNGETHTYGTGTYLINVEDTALEFSVMAPGASDPTNSRWAAAVSEITGTDGAYTGEDIEYIYVTDSDNEATQRSVYYTMPKGYTTKDSFGFDSYRSNSTYLFRYQPVVTYPADNDAWMNEAIGVGNNNMTYPGLITGHEDAGLTLSGNYKVYKLTFSVATLKSLITQYGGSWDAYASANVTIDETFGYNGTGTGLAGKVRFVIKKPNVFINYHDSAAAEVESWYCPTQSELSGLSNKQYTESTDGKLYYYVTPADRYMVYTQDDVKYAEYQTGTATGSTWTTEATLVYDEAGEEGAGWYDIEPTDNIHYVTARNIYYDGQHESAYIPQTTTCPSYDDAANSAMTLNSDLYGIKIKGEVYKRNDVRIIEVANTEYTGYNWYFVIVSKNTGYEMYYTYCPLNASWEQTKVNKKWVKVMPFNEVTNTFYWRQDTTGEYGWYDKDTENINRRNLSTLPNYAYIDTYTPGGYKLWGYSSSTWEYYYWSYTRNPSTIVDTSGSECLNEDGCLYLKVNDQDMYVVPVINDYNNSNSYYYRNNLADNGNARFVAYYQNGVFKYWLQYNGSTGKYEYKSNSISYIDR